MKVPTPLPWQYVPLELSNPDYRRSFNHWHRYHRRRHHRQRLQWRRRLHILLTTSPGLPWTTPLERLAYAAVSKCSSSSSVTFSSSGPATVSGPSSSTTVAGTSSSTTVSGLSLSTSTLFDVPGPTWSTIMPALACSCFQGRLNDRRLAFG